jgi:hypothetical protein
LDAHWQDYWPLLNELKEIAKTHNNTCCIVIDDFQVPNRPFKYDSYKNQPLNLQYVKQELKNIYTSPFSFYNDKTTRQPTAVGKLYCIPEEWKQSLTVPLKQEMGVWYVV